MVRHVPSGRYLTAELVVADIQVKNIYVLEGLGHPSPDTVMAEVQIVEVVGEPDSGHVEREPVPGQIDLSERLRGAEQEGRVTGELVVGEVEGVHVSVGVPRRDLAREPHYTQPL